MSRARPTGPARRPARSSPRTRFHETELPRPFAGRSSGSASGCEPLGDFVRRRVVPCPERPSLWLVLAAACSRCSPSLWPRSWSRGRAPRQLGARRDASRRRFRRGRRSSARPRRRSARGDLERALRLRFRAGVLRLAERRSSRRSRRPRRPARSSAGSRSEPFTAAARVVRRGRLRAARADGRGRAAGARRAGRRCSRESSRSPWTVVGVRSRSRVVAVESRCCARSTRRRGRPGGPDVLVVRDRARRGRRVRGAAATATSHPVRPPARAARGGRARSGERRSSCSTARASRPRTRDAIEVPRARRTAAVRRAGDPAWLRRRRSGDVALAERPRREHVPSGATRPGDVRTGRDATARGLCGRDEGVLARERSEARSRCERRVGERGSAVLLADASPLQNRLLGAADNAALGLAFAGAPRPAGRLRRERPRLRRGERLRRRAAALVVGARRPRARSARAGARAGRRLGPPERPAGRCRPRGSSSPRRSRSSSHARGRRGRRADRAAAPAEAARAHAAARARRGRRRRSRRGRGRAQSTQDRRRRAGGPGRRTCSPSGEALRRLERQEATA